MSTKKAKVYKFDSYRAEAGKSEAFVLDTGETQLVIPAPTGDTAIAIAETSSPRRVLEMICGEHYDAVWDLFGELPAVALNGLVLDMLRHFGLDAEAAPQGGGRALPR